MCRGYVYAPPGSSRAEGGRPMTMRELHAALSSFILEHPDHEAVDLPVIVRVDDGDGIHLHVGDLSSASVDAGCSDTEQLVLDADQPRGAGE